MGMHIDPIGGMRKVSKAATVAVLAGLFALSAGEPTLAQAPKAVELRIALSGGLDLLDPARSANGPDLAIMSQIYETLLELDPATNELKPKLAKSFELKSPTLWEFKLRDGVKFHDGTPFTAEDVKFSIERILDPATASAHFSQITSISNVKVVDALTVQIETKVPDPLLVRRMQPIGGSGRVFIVPKAYFSANNKQDVNDKPIGTGPYKLAEWRKGQSLSLARNEEYWGTKPDATKAVFTFIPENSTRVNALLQGEVDVIQRVPIADVGRVESAANAHIVSSPDGLVHTLLLDSRKPPFNDLDTRKAFAHALNMNNIIGNLLGKYGRVLGAPLGPNVVQLDKTIQPYKYDREMAKKLLGSKAPIEVSTYTSDGRYVTDREIYQAINSQLSIAGIKAKPQTLEWGRLISMMQSRSGGPFYIIGWDFGEGDASKMNSFLKSNSALSVTDDPTYDKLADAAGAEMDDAKRADLWKQAQKRIHDQYYVGAVWQAASIYGFSKKYNWKANYGDNLDLAGIKVATP